MYLFDEVKTSAASITFTYDSWKTIISSLQRMSDSGSFMDRKSSAHGARSSCSTPSDTVVQNVATSLILRGPDAKVGAERVVCRNSTTTGTNVDSSRDLFHECIATDTKAQEDNDSLSFSTSYPSWLNRNNSANGEVLYSGHVTNGYQRSACLISNGQAILPSLQVCVMLCCCNVTPWMCVCWMVYLMLYDGIAFNSVRWRKEQICFDRELMCISTNLVASRQMTLSPRFEIWGVL
jgi:hypothetical protein